MSPHDDTYCNLLVDILEDGDVRTDRTGTGTKALFGTQMKFDLADGFPLLTTKRVFWKGVVEELLWFLRGETNIASLQAAGVHIWDEWADENGDLGPVYGAQWRAWPTPPKAYASADVPEGSTGVRLDNGNVMIASQAIDQIDNLIISLVENPDSRRHIVTAWNPAEVDSMKLPPCHCLFQMDVGSDNRLNCQLYQRSADVFLGVPFNIASYALLTMMIAHVTGYKPGVFTWVGGNTHIYSNHLEQVNEQLEREPRDAPTVKLNPQVFNIFDFGPEDIELIGYDPHPAIKAEVAV